MYDVDNKNIKHNFINKITRKKMKKIYKKTDGYIFLSEPMNELINKKNKPYCVIEGISDTKTLSKNKKNEKTNKKIYMYAGALKKEYGLEILVKGFNMHKEKNAELWICGLGAYAEEINKISKKDKRIKYLGLKTNNEVIELERKANVLINPRPSHQGFTKYSFPSKIMEYMSTGTAVLTTKLPTIPKEYEKHLLFIEEESKEGMCKEFDKIANMSNEQINKQGQDAQEFMRKNKTEIIQSRKILNLLDDKNGNK